MSLARICQYCVDSSIAAAWLAHCQYCHHGYGIYILCKLSHTVQFNVLSVTDVWNTMLCTFLLFMSVKYSTEDFHVETCIRKKFYEKCCRMQCPSVLFPLRWSMTESWRRSFPTPTATCSKLCVLFIEIHSFIYFTFHWSYTDVELVIYTFNI